MVSDGYSKKRLIFCNRTISFILKNLIISKLKLWYNLLNIYWKIIFNIEILILFCSVIHIFLLSFMLFCYSDTACERLAPDDLYKTPSRAPYRRPVTINGSPVPVKHSKSSQHASLRHKDSQQVKQVDHYNNQQVKQVYHYNEARARTSLYNI